VNWKQRMENPRHSLLDRQRCCLAVIDVQASFLAKLAIDQRDALVARILWLMRAAKALDIPLLATGEDLARQGPVLPEISALLPPERPAFDKMVFNLHDQGDIRAAVEAMGRDQFVLTGLETDVCVAHSALGLQEAGYRVAVVLDACSTPPPHHDIAIARLRDAGVTVTNVKSIYYDWVRDLATLATVKPKIGPALPPGLTL
jgi:nicotinamidase-related amidase